jgi:hypothetical protein
MKTKFWDIRPIYTKIKRTPFYRDKQTSVILGFRLEFYEICALLGCYAASSGNPLPTFRDNVSAPSSRAKNMGAIWCPETSVKDDHSTPRNTPAERRYWKQNAFRYLYIFSMCSIYCHVQNKDAWYFYAIMNFIHTSFFT